MKKETKNDLNQKDKDWVDVHDDELMIELGIRPPHLVLEDIRTKTPNEKKLLSSYRKIHKGRMSQSVSPKRCIPVKAKLIIQLNSNNIFPKSTYSTECWMHEIGSKLLRYYNWNSKEERNECLINKYMYNGKTYRPDELPFWY